jgi:N-acetylglucosamine kinase-like BadF-type ATPase
MSNNDTWVLGVDAGGTRTVCLLADRRGEILSERRGPGANLQSCEQGRSRRFFVRLYGKPSKALPVAPAAICVGMAGVDREDDAEVVLKILSVLGFGAVALVVNDALIALEAGAGSEPGIVIITGTGSIAYGRDRNGRAARAGGWGYVLGDEGSGYWMGRLALRAVVRESDGRGRATLLTPFILSRFGVAKPEALIHEVYYRSMRPPAIAALAGLVQQACEEGDQVARAILEGAVDALLASAGAVAYRLGIQGDFPLVLSGGILRAVPLLASELQRQLPRVAPRSVPLLLQAEPAVGAVRLALRALAGNLRLPSYA